MTAQPGHPVRPARLALHGFLLLLTFASALFAQAPMLPGESLGDLLRLPFVEPARLAAPLAFATTLIAILLAHEMGHFLTARRRGVAQSLPYFIPAPLTFFGTMGAVIVMESQPRTRRDLMAVAVMGPYAGLVLAVPAAAWGLTHSWPAAGSEGELAFGSSLLFAALVRLFAPAAPDLALHPVAVAAWVGLLVTSLNLIPAAQLDGGHVTYALLRGAHARLSLAVALGLMAFGLFAACCGTPTGVEGATMWLVWGMLLFAIGIRHPPVADEAEPLGRAGTIHAAIALLLFVVTFIPVPLRLRG